MFGTVVAHWSGKMRQGRLIGVRHQESGRRGIGHARRSYVSRPTVVLSPACTRLLAILILAAAGSAEARSSEIDPPVWVGQWTTRGWSIAVAPDQTLLIADPHTDKVERYSEAGQLMATWGSEGSGTGQFLNPLGIGVGPNGDVYVTDEQLHRVQRFSSDGQFILSWGSEGSGTNQLSHPKSVAVGADGRVYIGDYGNSRVLEFHSDGTYVRSIGQQILLNVLGLLVSPSGEIYVTDRENRVLVFSESGDLVRSWGGSGTVTGRFENPVALALDGDSAVYVVDRLNHRIQAFSPLGEYLTSWGGLGSNIGEFAFPTDVAVISGGQIAVVDARNDRIQIFDFGVPVVQLSWSSLKTRTWR